MTDSRVIPNYQRHIVDVLSQPTPGRIPFSVEFMPPRDEAAERRLFDAALVFKDLGVSFVSVTYGAGGSTRDRTFRVAQQLAQYPLTTLVHLTLVDHPCQQLHDILSTYADAGLTNVLALRGDPPGDPLGPWTKTADGLEYASELIELIQQHPSCSRFEVGIASFPEGHHRADCLETDTYNTLRKLRAGAAYSITQMFFDVEHFLRLRDRLIAEDPEHGAKPIIPGIMPITSVRGMQRQVDLSGASVPAALRRRLHEAEPHGADYVRSVGIELSTELAERLIAEGVPGMHFMTLNNARATQEVLHNLGMAPAWGVDKGHDAIR
ncbi:methylenetetrahydrofolate reductase [Corynebacterium epidermidicanis]|uniref:Methylenetetrahydrofolate reductase n=1 Tax=Corynebacterium epidermidicanis TaxID=1050174 RepID=A0A0G3GQX1_9CORY|nr:methylenetetrahydrofolate reductase [Corynebacterium epidermidicanis]AKK03534.1 5,10-methylenetetrahydrofolate reductase [Corynebacterium epidermidicanis]